MTSRRWPWLIAAAFVATTIAVERLEGRRWWCQCGSASLISGAWSEHTSQHLLDPYSFSHVVHGILLAGLAWLVARRASMAWQFCLALAVECCWEMIENSEAVIDRFRTANAAFGYHGDSVLNSVGDILSCAVGIVVARRIGLWWAMALAIVIETALLITIRDNLLLDVVMLVYPIDSVRAWQMGH
jgi:hypothetical protein